MRNMENKKQKIKDELATGIINACGRTGVLNAVDNSELNGDLKIRHKKAVDEARKVGASKTVQAICARMFGLI